MKTTTKWIVSTGLVLGLLAGCSSEPDYERYNVQKIGSYYDGYFASYIQGTLVADKDYDYLQIEIPCYDSNGNNIGSALANVNNLKEGETWRFEAMILDKVSKYSLQNAEVTGY